MKLGFVVLYVEDVSKSLEFYTNAFDLEVRMKHEDQGQLLYGELETEGAILGLASHQLGQMNLGDQYLKLSELKKPVGQEIVFVTADVEGSFQKALDAGATEFAKPSTKPWGQTVAFIQDLDGALIELCTPMNP